MKKRSKGKVEWGGIAWIEGPSLFFEGTERSERVERKERKGKERKRVKKGRKK